MIIFLFMDYFCFGILMKIENISLLSLLYTMKFKNIILSPDTIKCIHFILYKISNKKTNQTDHQQFAKIHLYTYNRNFLRFYIFRYMNKK